MRTAFIICMLISTISLAHVPNEFGYQLTLNNLKQELIVHVTPQAALDLLFKELPDLKSEETILFEEYVDFFESYFREKVIITLENQIIDLNLIDMQLYQHDATLTFQLSNLKQNYGEFHLKVQSFLELYKKIENLVVLDLSNNTYKFLLNKNQTQATIHIPESFEKSENQSYIGFNIIILLIISCVGLYFWLNLKSQCLLKFNK